MSVINTNVSASLTQNALAKNERAMAKTMEQLSTGKRINSASDDAAGLAISSRMTSQIRGVTQAVRNANDAIAMLQTADGALIEVTNMMQRMRELAVQSASDTNTSTDRAYLDKEFTQLAAEIQRIGANTQWNGENVLDGSVGTSGSVIYQIGANASQTVNHTFESVKTAGVSAGTQTITTNAAKASGEAYTHLKLTATTTGTGSGVSTLFKTTSSTTVSATASTGIAQTSFMQFTGASFEVGQTLTISIDSVNYSFDVTSVNANGRLTGLTQHGSSTEITTTATAIASTTAAGSISLKVQANALTLTGTTKDGDFTVSSPTASNDATTISYLASGLAAATYFADISTQAGSNSAIKSLDHTITQLNEERATTGSVINRLQYAADNLSNVKTNAEASRSRVEDADYAAATTELARTQIIAQAATAILAQANQMPQTVLSLLR